MNEGRKTGGVLQYFSGVEEELPTSTRFFGEKQVNQEALPLPHQLNSLLSRH